MGYQLLYSGARAKLERFVPHIITRPSLLSIWNPMLPEEEWEKAHAIFEREGGWSTIDHFPERWTVCVEQIQFSLRLTGFGHLGIFPEHAQLWKWIGEKVKDRGRCE